MKNILVSTLVLFFIFICSCVAEDEDEDTGNTGNDGDVSDTGDNFPNSHAGLNWSLPSEEEMSFSDAKDYCHSLIGRVPAVSELRTLLKDCAPTVTGGSCKVTDDCLSHTACWSEICMGCDATVSHSVFNDKGWFWSGSQAADSSYSWRINFDDGHIGAYEKGSRHYVRCVQFDEDLYCIDGDERITTCEEDSTKKQRQICVYNRWVDEGHCICSDNNLFCHSHGGLEWSDISEEGMVWNDIESYCQNLGGRVPNIQELRMLIKECPGTEYPKPQGEEEWCEVEDPDKLVDEEDSACHGCHADYSAEGAGKYSVFGDETYLWSLSVPPFTPDSAAWVVNFEYGGVIRHPQDSAMGVRCVK